MCFDFIAPAPVLLLNIAAMFPQLYLAHKAISRRIVSILSIVLFKQRVRCTNLQQRAVPKLRGQRMKFGPWPWQPLLRTAIGRRAIGRLPEQFTASEGADPRMTQPSPKAVHAIAAAAGVPVDAEVATRIANSIGPAFAGFAAIAGTLPFDLEPASFVVVQATAKAAK
jgi:hypothetical protein